MIFKYCTVEKSDSMSYNLIFSSNAKNVAEKASLSIV